MLDTNQMIIIGGIALFLLIVILLSSISIKKRNRLVIIDSLQDRINTLKALPIQYLLNKVSLMPKTLEVEEKYHVWKDEYEQLSNEENAQIKQEFNDIEAMIYARKFKKAKHQLNNLDARVCDYENRYENLLNELTQATQIDVKNREEITNQKELFRNYKKMYKSNSENYKPFNSTIERYLKNIEDYFTNIDVLLNQSQVDKAKTERIALENELIKMKDILNNLPAILDDLINDLPNKYKDVEFQYNEVISKKYNINNLDIANRLDGINKDIVSALTKTNEIFLNDLETTSHLAHHELDKIKNDLFYEIRANEQLEEIIEDLVDKSISCNQLIKQVNEEFDEIKDLYVLHHNESKNLELENELLEKIEIEKNELVALQLNTNYIASELEIKARKLLPIYNALVIALNAYKNNIHDKRADEKRIWDEYYNMLYIIKDCETRLKDMNLPMLSQAYYDTIAESKNGVEKIIALLNEKPLNIDFINKEVSYVSDSIYKLYDNSRNLLKTAQMAENAIVYANRYRSTYPEINSKVELAQIFFNNGEYTKSLSSAIEALEIKFSSIRKELLKYKSEQTTTPSL